VHSPKCGSGNRPIDKAAAAQTLRLLLAREELPIASADANASPEAPLQHAHARAPEPVAPRVIHFDLETQRSAAEVGGWHNAHLMRVALAVVWDSRTGEFETFHESRVAELVERLHTADLVVGFNVKGFDYQVLRGYGDFDLESLPTFDMLEAIHRRLGFRLALNHLGEETLGVGKSADGLQSLQWWKEGRVDEIEKYCRADVALMRNLLAHAEEHGHLCFRTRNGERVRLPAAWRIPDLIEEIASVRGEAAETVRAKTSAAARTGYARGATP
jgi:DEAD/DEAH box helicase domain-containing protein